MNEPTPQNTTHTITGDCLAYVRGYGPNWITFPIDTPFGAEQVRIHRSDAAGLAYSLLGMVSGSPDPSDTL